MWRAAAVFLVILPAAALIGWWAFYRSWRRSPVGQARRAAAERREQAREDDLTRRLDP